jgi:hypothetical protein
LRQSPGQKTHRYASYDENDRTYDHKIFAKGGRKLLAEVYPCECDVAIERRFKVAQQMQYYTLRQRKPRKSRAVHAPPVKQAERFHVEVFTDEEALTDEEPDAEEEEDLPPAPPPSPDAPWPTPGHLRARQWRAEAYATLPK